MTLKRRVEKLESQAPTDEWVEILGYRMKASVAHRIIEEVEGTVLRPKSEDLQKHLDSQKKQEKIITQQLLSIKIKIPEKCIRSYKENIYYVPWDTHGL